MKKKKGLSIGLTIGIIVILLAIFPEQIGSLMGLTFGTIERLTHLFIIACILTLVIFGGIIYLLYLSINKLLNLKKK